MDRSRLRLVLFFAVSLVVFAVYLGSVAPTASFWDCGELIAVSYIAGVPHPPGTPLFVMLGRIFSMLPLAREYAMRVNLIPVLFGAASCGLIYLLVVKLISLQYARPDEERFRWLPHVAGLFAALACGFAYSYWDNCVEAEVYGPCVVVALSVLYIALLWRDGVVKGTGDNRLILAAMFLLFLSTGIHFTPMMTVFALLAFGLVVDRHAVLNLRFFEFVFAYLIILVIGDAELGAGTFIGVPLMLAGVWSGIKVMERSESTMSVLYGLGLLFGAFVTGYVATGGRLMDDTVLFLASPTVAFIEQIIHRLWVVLLVLAGYAGYLFWLHARRRLTVKYVALMLGLVLLAGTVQFIMMIRAHHRPSINEVEPSNWRDFVGVLRREQYDPMKLLPRKTQFLREEEWRSNENPRFGLLRAYTEQVAFYVRYFFWQWGNERFFDMLFTNFPRIFLRLDWKGLLGLIPPLLGLWGMWRQFRKEKRSFALIFVAFLVASVGLITYLNLKYSPSDPRRGDPAQGKLGYLEVRERDYFYAFSFVFFTVFIGVGAHAFLRWAAAELKNRRLPVAVLSGALLAYGFVPMGLNYQGVTRRHNWIPAEYGYNMLVSCEGDHAVVFTNGDNDTFPLWFMQTVPSRIADYDPMFGKNVAVANLSLLNTTWYCKQLKRWGAPISFTEEEIGRLPQYILGYSSGRPPRRDRVMYLKDIMIRNIIATSGGTRLVWPKDYESPAEEFMAKVFGTDTATGRSRFQPTSPVYFATTVSPDNLSDVSPYLMYEGLVRRVVPTAEPAPGEGQVNITRTRELLFGTYRTSSMLDPRVVRDENTVGLMTNYAHSHLMLSVAYQRAGLLQEAQEALAPALRFDLDSSQKALLFLNLSRFALLNRSIDTALVAADSAAFYGGNDPRLQRDIALQGGYAHEAAGDYEGAERLLRWGMNVSGDRERGMWVELLYRLYVEAMHDTAKARQLLNEWLRLHPNDGGARQLLQQIGGAPPG